MEHMTEPGPDSRPDSGPVRAGIDPDALYREPAALEHSAGHPAGGAMVTVTVAGCRIFGMLYLPRGDGPHPVTILLHGLPGAVRGEDVAQALRRAGMGAFIFSYRGSWGSEGEWSYQHCHEDAMAVVQALRDPDLVARYRLAPERLVLLGHSLGGLIAMTVARQTTIRDVILMSPADAAKQWRSSMSLPGGQEKRLERLRELCASLRATSAEQIWEDVAADLDAFDLVGAVSQLTTDKRFLLIGATYDTLLPPAQYLDPLVEALEQRMPGCVTTCMMPTGHNYNSHRMELARTVLLWLRDMGY